MEFDDIINAYFVTTEKSREHGQGEATKDMQKAFECLQAHLSEEHIRQIKASEGFPLIASGTLTKKDVFIFDNFAGAFFEQLQQTRSLIIGPRCLINCLETETPIPQGTSPVYVVAMRDIKISASGLKAQEKEELKQLVHWMGGNYFQNFGRGITHLVSNTIKSTKYEHATLNGIPVMHPDWVQRVWERNRITDVAATDSEFDKYRLPIFYGINVSCTGLDATSRNEVMRLVNENGGTFHRAFRSQQVDIVITEKGCTNSEKYKAAVRYKKDILLPEWIYESVQKGFALPTKNYYVRNLKVSTPTKNEQAVPDFTLNSLADFSRISVASSRRDNETINDTASTNDDMPGTSKSLQREVLKKANTTERYRLVYEEICASEAKKAGTFLDGCCIYLSGFRAEEREKLNRILNVGGATRYDVVNEKITHIIVGQLDDNEFRTWQKAGYLNSIHVVRLNWLLESIKQQHTASENVYRMSLPTTREPDAPSPSSKRTLRSMNHSFKQPDLPIKRKLFLQNDAATKSPEAVSPPKRAPTPEATDVDQLIAQYTHKNNAATNLPTVANDSTLMQPVASSTQYHMKQATVTTDQAELNTIDYEHLNFLQGMTVYLVKETMPEELFVQLEYECESAQGSIVSHTFRDTVDYAVVSFEQAFDVNSLPVKVRHVVTELYIETCLKLNRLVPIEYYHKHIPQTSAVQPLKNMTIVISLYTNLEKDYLQTLAQLLGANVNTAYVKKEQPLLVCQAAEGSKYNGALKWRFPIVHAEYLVQCAEQGKKLPFAAYLVGESVDDFPFSTNTTECPTTAVVSTPEITPLRNKRVSELAGNSFMQQNMAADSPHTPLNSVGRGRYNFEIMEKIADEFEDAALRQNLKELINEMRKEQTPELERLRRQAYTPENRNIPTPKGIPEFCTTPAFEKRMEDAFERLFKLPITKLKPDTPVPEILRRAIIETCKSFGIPVDNENQPPSTSKAVNNTPLFQKSVAPRAIFAETVKEPVPETQNNNTIVAEKSSRQSDTFVPDTQSPNNSQSVLMPRASLGKTSINFDKINFEDTSQTSKHSIVSHTSSPELMKISEFLKNSGRGSIAKDQVTKQNGEGIQDTQEAFVGPFLSEKFSVGTQEMVVWKDKTVTDKHLETDEETKRNEIKYFSLSCDPEKLEDLIKKIQGLGGVVSDNLTNFDPKSTHFVCERPNRGEKMMGSIASGKWVLTMNYIEHSHAKGMFLQEELYEWGSATTLEIPTITADEQTIVNAAHCWRKKLLNDHSSGAFTGMKAILRIGPRTYEPLKNVLQAGGAEVIEARSPYGVHNNAHQCSHCFVDIKKFPLQAADYRFLKKHNIIVVTQMYINAFLMKVGDVELDSFEVQM